MFPLLKFETHVGVASAMTLAATALALPYFVAQATTSSASQPLLSEKVGSTAGYLIIDPPKTFTVGNNLLDSTAIYVLLKLNELALSYPDMATRIEDARSLARSLPPQLPRPKVWTDNETEVAFEWKKDSLHAMISFEGDQSFGYALRRGNRFVPGSFPGDLSAEFPRDLLNYLTNKRVT